MKRIATLALFMLIMVLPAANLHAQVYDLFPNAVLQFFDNDGLPLSGGKLHTCSAGTTCTCSSVSNPRNSYSDTSGTLNANPVVLDSGGRATIYLDNNNYKIALCTSADVIVKTQDNIRPAGLSALENFIHTTNTIAKFGGSSTLATSQITDNGTTVNIGTANGFTTDLVLAKNNAAEFSISEASSDFTGPFFSFYKSRGTIASPGSVVNGDVLFQLGASGYVTSGFWPGASIVVQVDSTPAFGYVPTRMTFGTTSGSGVAATHLAIDKDGITNFVGGGITVAAPTGGAKGSGTINLQGDIYKNNTAYTNPDYVFEHYYTGKIRKFASHDGAASYKGLQSLKQIEAYAKKYYELPHVGSTSGIFERADAMLQTTEEIYLHLFEMQHEIDALKQEINKLEAKK